MPLGKKHFGPQNAIFGANRELGSKYFIKKVAKCCQRRKVWHKIGPLDQPYEIFIALKCNKFAFSPGK